MSFFSSILPAVDRASSCIVLRGNEFKSSSGLDGLVGRPCDPLPDVYPSWQTHCLPFSGCCQRRASCQRESVSPQWRATYPQSAFRALCEDIHGWNSLLLLICLLFFEFPRLSWTVRLLCVAFAGWGIGGAWQYKPKWPLAWSLNVYRSHSHRSLESAIEMLLHKRKYGCFSENSRGWVLCKKPANINFRMNNLNQ